MMFSRRFRRDPASKVTSMPASSAPAPDPATWHEAYRTLRARYEDRPWFAGVDVGADEENGEPVLVLYVRSRPFIHPPGEDLPYVVRVAGELVPVLVRVAGAA